MTHRQLAILAVAFVSALMVGAGVQSGSAASLNLGTQNLTPYRTCIVTATPSTTTKVSDTTVRQATATTNYGTGTTLDVSSATLSSNRRAYIQFDLTGCTPSIPASATVRAATLRIYASTLSLACRTLDIFRVTATWAEGTLTWNTQPTLASTRTDSFDVGSVSGCQNTAAGYVTGADVTADVATYIAGTATNYGWMIRDDTENSATTRTESFSAKDLGTISQAPQLIVTYVTTP